MFLYSRFGFAILFTVCVDESMYLTFDCGENRRVWVGFDVIFLVDSRLKSKHNRMEFLKEVISVAG